MPALLTDILWIVLHLAIFLPIAAFAIRRVGHRSMQQLQPQRVPVSNPRSRRIDL